MVCCLMETWVVMQDGGHLGCHLIFYPIFRSYQKTAEIVLEQFKKNLNGEGVPPSLVRPKVIAE